MLHLEVFFAQSLTKIGIACNHLETLVKAQCGQNLAWLSKTFFVTRVTCKVLIAGIRDGWMIVCFLHMLFEAYAHAFDRSRSK